MLEWLKQKIRGWLLEGQPVSLDIEVNGSKLHATGVMGLCLVCANEFGSRLVSAREATSKTHFWALWKQLGGKAYWEDGTEFIPPK